MTEKVVVSCPSCGQSYQLDAGKVGRSFPCAACGQSFVAAPAVPPATGPVAGPTAGPPTSSIAVASLVAGVPFCVPGLNLAALILGIVGLIQTSPGRARGRGFAVAGTLLGAVGVVSSVVVIGVFVPLQARLTQRLQSAQNLRTLGTALTVYTATHRGQYPPDLATLWADNPTLLTAAAFVEPDTADTPAVDPAHLLTGGHCSYVYTAAGLWAPQPPSTIIAHEPKQPGFFGPHALYANGTTRILTGARATAAFALADHQRPTTRP